MVQLIRDLSNNLLQGDFSTNATDENDQNAVTWGVFPGKEIIQPTIIEKASFEAWKVSGFFNLT